MKLINFFIVYMIAAAPVPEGSSNGTNKHDHKAEKKCDGPGTFTQQLGALMAFQDPSKACGHDHGKAHFGLQTPEEAYTDTPVGQGFGFNFFNPIIEGAGKLLGLN